MQLTNVNVSTTDIDSFKQLDNITTDLFEQGEQISGEIINVDDSTVTVRIKNKDMVFEKEVLGDVNVGDKNNFQVLRVTDKQVVLKNLQKDSTSTYKQTTFNKNIIKNTTIDKTITSNTSNDASDTNVYNKSFTLGKNIIKTSNTHPLTGDNKPALVDTKNIDNNTPKNVKKQTLTKKESYDHKKNLTNINKSSTSKDIDLHNHNIKNNASKDIDLHTKKMSNETYDIKTDESIKNKIDNLNAMSYSKKAKHDISSDANINKTNYDNHIQHQSNTLKKIMIVLSSDDIKALEEQGNHIEDMDIDILHDTLLDIHNQKETQTFSNTNADINSSNTDNIQLSDTNEQNEQSDNFVLPQNTLDKINTIVNTQDSVDKSQNNITYDKKIESSEIKNDTTIEHELSSKHTTDTKQPVQHTTDTKQPVQHSTDTKQPVQHTTDTKQHNTIVEKKSKHSNSKITNTYTDVSTKNIKKSDDYQPTTQKNTKSSDNITNKTTMQKSQTISTDTKISKNNYIVTDNTTSFEAKHYSTKQNNATNTTINNLINKQENDD